MKIKTKAKIMLGTILMSGLCLQATKTNALRIGEARKCILVSLYEDAPNYEAFSKRDYSRLPRIARSVNELYEELKKLPDSSARQAFLRNLLEPNFARYDELFDQAMHECAENGFDWPLGILSTYEEMKECETAIAAPNISFKALREYGALKCSVGHGVAEYLFTINLQNENGNNLLHLIAIDGRTDILNDVWSAVSGSSPHSLIWGDIFIDMLSEKNDGGDTPYHMAAFYGNVGFLSFVQDHFTGRLRDIGLHEKNEEGQTALDLAREAQQGAIIRAIQSLEICSLGKKGYVLEHDKPIDEEYANSIYNHGRVIDTLEEMINWRSELGFRMLR